MRERDAGRARGPRHAVARLWEAPLAAHLAALAAVLVALLPVVGTGASFLPDEGAAILQAQSLSAGRGWIVEHPLPGVDGAGRHYPLELAAEGPRGSAPFAKHPLYALMLAGADRVGGVGAMVGLSLAGVVLAAAAAALLAGHLSPGLARPAVWATGVGSPLLFDGYLVIAHALGAATAAAAVLVAVLAVERGRWKPALLVAPLVALTVLLRNEGLFLATGLAAAGTAVALRSRIARSAGLVTAAAAGAAAVLAHLGERIWVGSIVGQGPSPVAAPLARGSAGLLEGRIEGFMLTWLTPAYEPEPLVVVPLVFMALALGVGAFLARRSASAGPLVTASALAATAAVTALVANRGTIVPGLLVAFPLAVVGLVTLRRSVLARTDVFLAAVTVAVFCLGVLATQYSTGGTGEWGGRYFALILPVAVPVLLLAGASQARALVPLARQGAVVALVTCSLALAGMAVVSLRANHQAKLQVIAAIDRAGQRALPPDGEDPVVVGTGVGMPRQAWPTFYEHRWLLSPSSQLRGLLGELDASGVDRLVLVTAHREWDEPALAGLEVVRAERAPSLGVDVLVLRAGDRP